MAPWRLTKCVWEEDASDEVSFGSHRNMGVGTDTKR